MILRVRPSGTDRLGHAEGAVHVCLITHFTGAAASAAAPLLSRTHIRIPNRTVWAGDPPDAETDRFAIMSSSKSITGAGTRSADWVVGAGNNQRKAKQQQETSHHLLYIQYGSGAAFTAITDGVREADDGSPRPLHDMIGGHQLPTK